MDYQLVGLQTALDVQPQVSPRPHVAVRNAAPTDSAPPGLAQARGGSGTVRHSNPSTGAGPQRAADSDRGGGVHANKGKGDGGSPRNPSQKRSADELGHGHDVSRKHHWYST